MANRKDERKALDILKSGREQIWKAWEIIPDGRARKQLTTVLHHLDAAINKVTPINPGNRPFQPKDRVMIYMDPTTKTREEGEAILMERMDSDDPYSKVPGAHPELEYWQVIFLSDGFRCNRFIKPEN